VVASAPTPANKRGRVEVEALDEKEEIRNISLTKRGGREKREDEIAMCEKKEFRLCRKRGPGAGEKRKKVCTSRVGHPGGKKRRKGPPLATSRGKRRKKKCRRLPLGTEKKEKLGDFGISIPRKKEGKATREKKKGVLFVEKRGRKRRAAELQEGDSLGRATILYEGKGKRNRGKKKRKRAPERRRKKRDAART